MASGGNGRGHGRDGPRRSISMKGKGTMIDNLGRNNPTYHEYLQHQTYAEDLGLNYPRPPLIISEPDPNTPNDTPVTTPHNLTSQSDNMPYIDTPPDFDFDPPEVELQEEEDLIQKKHKSDLFVKHMKKVRK